MTFEVSTAECAGACYGVKRALDQAHQTIEQGIPAVTLGPLIHNPQVVSSLASEGVRAVDDPADAGNRAIIIRSHGVTPQVRRSIEATGNQIVDATCPYVVRAQKAAASLASECKTVVVVGESSHPEVAGLCAYARELGARVVVVADGSEIPADLEDPVGVVVQTTQTRPALEGVVAALRECGHDPSLHDTICNATVQRQQAAADLASTVDAMVVIGGHNSSNTTRLFEICESTCPRAFHIETADEIDPAWFSGCSRVGVTAGASTPDDQIRSVVDRLGELGR